MWGDVVMKKEGGEEEEEDEEEEREVGRERTNQFSAVTEWRGWDVGGLGGCGDWIDEGKENEEEGEEEGGGRIRERNFFFRIRPNSGVSGFLGD